MNRVFTEGHETVAWSHRIAVFTRAAGRTRRVVGTAALTLATSVAIAVPLQVSAQAAPAEVRSSSTSLAAAVRHDGAKLSQATYETRLRTWVNRIRQDRGVRPISVRPCHDGFAERWTGFLTRNSEFRHQDLGPYMDRCKLSKAGEILALGGVTPRRMVWMWMHSPEHRRILLDRSFGLSGIAARRDPRGYWVGCIDFGRRMG
jgi:uncharacterized protein YkwD